MRINLMTVYRRLCLDLGLCSSDAAYIVRRLKDEGSRFATSTLPALSKVVLHAVEIGNFYEAIKSQNFTSIARKGRSLRYFRSLLGQIFCLKTGNLLAAPSGPALYALRSLCEYAYKLSLAFSEKQLSSYTETFLINDKNVLSIHSGSADTRFLRGLRGAIERHYKELFSLDPTTVLSEYPPRPGPGTYSGAPKDWYQWKHCPSPFLYRKFIVGGFRRLLRTAHTPSGILAKQVPSATFSELLFVPKDSRGPRVIVREPRDALLFQMSFHDWFSESVQRRSAGRIQFVDQSRNQKLAREGSLTKQWSTLDLKDASDMVSYDIVSYLFRNSPSVRFFLKNFRTSRVYLPHIGKFHGLRKLSGMGSGFTFPIMAFLCHSAISYLISVEHSISFRAASMQVHVFGDDICVPSTYFGTAIRALSLVGFKVNYSKSYHKGPFRESCGGDFLEGIDVAPTRLRLSNSSLEAKGFFLEAKNFDSSVFELSQHTKELTLNGFYNLRGYYESLIANCVTHYPECSNFEFSGVVRYREYADYRPEMDGTYPKVPVLTYVPAKDDPYDQTYTYKCSLRRGYKPLDAGPSFDKQKVAVPRKGYLRKKEVSSLSLLGLG